MDLNEYSRARYPGNEDGELFSQEAYEGGILNFVDKKLEKYKIMHTLEITLHFKNPPLTREKLLLILEEVGGYNIEDGWIAYK